MISLNSSTLYSHLLNCLRAWNSTSLPVDSFQELLTLKQKTGDPQGSLRRFVLENINALESDSQEQANILKVRFFEGATLKEVAHEWHLSMDQVNRRQRQALEHLADHVYQKESKLRETRLDGIQARLPASGYTRLFGIEGHKQNLLETLTHSDKYHIVALVGLGGIGKSSLADAAIRELAPTFHFNDIVWVRFPQTNGSRPLSPFFVFNWLISKLAAHFDLEEHSDHHKFLWVRQYLNQARYLVVIDNLHNESQDTQLFKKLEELTNPSKILITTRTHPAPQATVYSIPMNEISVDEATELLVYQLDALGQNDRAKQIKEHTPKIYRTAGGNPLALKLCAGLLYTLPLPVILDEMEHRQINDIQDLYAYIYSQLWKGLSANAQTLLEAMPLVDDTQGAHIEHIGRITDLPEKDIHQAIHELSLLSLIEPQGTIEQRRYSIHQLTRNFLLKEIIAWDEDLN